VPTAFILAVDVGAGSLRAGLVDTRGRVRSAAAVPLAIGEPRPGFAEIDPEAWWRALLGATSRVLRVLPKPGRIAGVCICGLTRTQVLLDRKRRPLGPAIAFRDTRAAAIAREMPGVSAFDAKARLAWVAKHQPARYARIDTVVEPREFLAGRLTGEFVTGLAPWQAVGVVKEGALAGVPVFAGAMDTWACAVGAGAVLPGQAYDVAGTSEAVGLLTAHPASVPGLVSLQWTEDAHQVGGPTQAGADCAVWCHAAFRVRDRLAEAVARAGGGPFRAHAPVFLPYLAGERAPVWNSDVRGAFHGIGRSTTADDFLWSVLEGVAMAVRDVLEVAQAGSDVTARALHVAGGGARSDAWCRMKADVTNLTVIRSAEAETGLVGAAMAAAVGLGLATGLGDAAAKMVTRLRRFQPRQARVGAHEARFAQYRLIKQAALALAERRN
jgi:xylulokinase